MLNIPANHGLPYIEQREFDVAHDAEAIDEALAWLAGSDRAATLLCADGRRRVGLSADTFDRLDDFTLGKAYLPYWERSRFAVEDMPTIQDVLMAADGDLLEDVFLELLESAPSPSGRPEAAGALAHALLEVGCLKHLDFESCDDNPLVAVPYAFYRCDPATKIATREMQVRVYPVAEIGQWNPLPYLSDARYSWPKALGFKAWFGGVSIRDSYRALAWFIGKMLMSSFVEYGIWLGDLPDDGADDPTQELMEAALASFRARMEDLASRIITPDDRAAVSCQEEEASVSA